MEKFFELLGYLFFAVALNMDSLGVGFSYGLRRIKIPFISVLLISLLSMAAIIFSMLVGQQIGEKISSAAAMRLGGITLVIIGIIALYQYYKQEKNGKDPTPPVSVFPGEEKHAERPFFRISVFGLIFQILRNPYKADIDKSGTISLSEAFLLGITLAMDSLAAGVAVSLIGYNIIITALFVGIGHFVLIYLGLSAGRGLSRNFLGRQISALPSLILIMLGINKMY